MRRIIRNPKLYQGGFWSAVAGAAIGAVGSFLGQKSANDANSAAIDRQVEFQREMSNTQYQRATKDLKAAGLNPMLAYTNGGASSPSGAAAHFENEMKDATNSASTGAQVKAIVDNLKAQTDKTRADEALVRMMEPKVQAETIAATNSAAYTAAQTGMIPALTDRVLQETANMKDEQERIKRSTELIIEQTKNMPITADQIRAAINLTNQSIIQSKVVTEKEKHLGNEAKARSDITHLAIPRALNESSYQQDSWFAKNIAPWLPDLLKGSSTASQLSR